MGVALAAVLVLCGSHGTARPAAATAAGAGAGASAEPPPRTAVTEQEAAKAARASGTPVEVLALRGESREVRALPSGNFELVQHQRPVRTRKEGAWTEVNPNLMRLPGGGLAPVAATVDLRLSEGGSEPFVTMGRVGRTLSLSWPEPLPAPVVHGDTATYPEVLPGVDLTVRADVDGFAHLLVVKTPQAARDPALARLRLKTRTRGLDLAADASGVLRATGEGGGGPVFEAPAPLMWDSGPVAGLTGRRDGGQVARPAVDGPAEGSRVARVGVGIEEGELTLFPDRDLLTGQDTTYPVYIDPVWKTVGESARLMVSSGYPSTTYYNWTGTQGVGLCDVQFDGACVKDQKKRLFFRMPIGSIAGKYVISAEFIAYETHAYNCSNPTVVQLWHASGFGATSTWNSTDDNWIKHLASRDVAYCSRTPVEFGGTALRDVVRAAVTRKDANVNFGLRAYSEATMDWWKRFTADADLRIEYNTPPPQPLMKNLSMSPGGPCVYADPPAVNRLPTLYAVLTDPDSGSAAKLQAQFRIQWDDNTGSWTAPLTAAKTSGSTFQVTAPADIPRNKVLSWIVRTWDGHQWSPWSSAGEATGCYFSYDDTAPPAPTVSSADYPPSDPENPDDPWHEGVGRYGSFTISTSQSDVNRYWVGVNATPTAAGEYRPAVPGGPVTVPIAPTRAGVNFLYVKALDAAGNTSAATTYLFRVSAGSAPRAHWRLDEPAGATTLAANVRPGTAAVSTRTVGGVTMGVDGQVGTALRGDGSSGYAETTAPVIDTSKTYSVGAWVRLAHTNRFATVLNQDGTVVSGFFLQYVKDDDRWSFSLTNADAVQGGVRVRSTSPPEVGEWTYLLGVYDAVARKARLYVNGVLQEEKPFTVTWNATGPMSIGRALHGGVKQDFFPGEIDDVQVFDRLVSDEEAADLFTRHPVLAGRWTLNTDGADGSGHGRHLVLSGDARVDQAAGWLGTPAGALVMDGAGDHAATATPVVSTGRSFTVAGWASAAGAPTAKAAVFSQAGAVNSGFTVRYDPAAAGGAGGWQVEMPDADTAGAVSQGADHSSYRDHLDWDHIAVVYDSFADVLRLYVNGWLEETEERVSVRWHTIGFDATGPFQLGRSKTAGVWGEHWAGAIDDVWVFEGVLDQEKIQTLAGYTEIPSDSPF